MPQSKIVYDFFSFDYGGGSILERFTKINLLDSKGYDELHYIFPVGRHHLAITSSGNFQIFSPLGEYPLPKFALSGCFTLAYYFGAEKGENEITILTFNPSVLSQKFGIDVSSIAHQHVDLQSCVDWDENVLLEIANLKSDAKYKTERFNEYFESQVLNKESKEISLTENVLQLAHSHPELNLYQIADKLEILRSRIDRDYIKIMGVTPGKYFGLMRIYNVLMAMVKKPEATLEELANFFHYSDHSHLIKDFRKRLAMSPAEFKEKELVVLKSYLESTPASYVNLQNL